MPDSSNNRTPTFRSRLRWLLVVAWCGVIFTASHQPNLRVSDDDLLDLILRKSAHLAVFAVLALLLAYAIRGGGRWRLLTLVSAWGATLAWAISDEWHQRFITGRVGHASDVVIDMVGATLALLVLYRWRVRPSSRPSPPHVRPTAP